MRRGRGECARRQPGRREAGLTPDQLEEDEADEAGDGRPAPEPLRVPQGRRLLLADQGAEAGRDDVGDRPPWVESAKDVPEQDAEDDDAEPERHEDERHREVPVGGIDAVDPGPDDEEQQRDADRPGEDSRRPPRQRRAESPPEGAPVVVLEPDRSPAERQADERHDQDDRRAPGEQPVGQWQVGAADQAVSRRRARQHGGRHRGAEQRPAGDERRPAAGPAGHGLTVSSAICVAELSSSTSKTPSMSAGKSNSTVPPAFTSSPMS